MNKAGVVYYLLGDHLGSTVKVLNSGGTPCPYASSEATQVGAERRLAPYASS